jgi:hypothetical protein
LLHIPCAGQGIEIAIIAFMPAEGNVNVYSCHWKLEMVIRNWKIENGGEIKIRRSTINQIR